MPNDLPNDLQVHAHEPEKDTLAAMAMRTAVIVALLAICWAIWTYLPGWLESTLLADYWLIVTIGVIVLALSAAQIIQDKVGVGQS